MARVDEVARGIYRICTAVPLDGMAFQFNQFLIEDERPALIHTGTFPMYEDVRKAVGEVLDPGRLAYVVCPHFEADECGGMGRFVAEAPEAVLACSDMGAGLNLTQWDYSGPVRGFRDGEVIDLGEHKLRFLETPHVHHWDSMMVYEEHTRSLFPADLFIQPGEQPVVVTENLGREMCGLYREVGIFGGDRPVLQAVDRIERLAPAWVHPMHGGSMTGDTLAGYIAALRTHPFTYEGKVLGRMLPS